MRKTTIILVAIVVALLFYFLFPKPSASHADEFINPVGLESNDVVLKSTIENEVPIVVIKPKVVPTSLVVAHTAYVTGGMSAGEVEALVIDTFPDAPIMVKVAKSESGFSETIRNKDTGIAAGVFQILPSTWKSTGCTGDILNAVDNINCGRKLYDTRGLQPWDASKSIWSK